MKNKIKALLFDLGGVIIFYDHMIAARKMSQEIHVSPKKIFNILNDNDGQFTNSYELGAPREVYWGIMAKKLGIKKIPPKKFDRLWTEIFKPNKKMFKLLIKLKKKYNLVLISNIGSLHQKFLEDKCGLRKIFHTRIYSYKIGARKPKKKIYLTALKKLKVKPMEAIFIDDRRENIIAAKKLGMKVILFNNNRQLQKLLK